jgi:4-amino-4-deoxy-L-arabinose transferase-like glycosyltransferase
MGGLFGGPLLGEAEAIVAACARHMRISGDWVVPVFMEVPLIRQTPLPSWLIGATSYCVPPDAAGRLPVTTLAARVPSALAGLATVLLTWWLGAGMFGRRVGIVAAVLASSCVGVMFYSPNATAGMLLTCCCAWAYCHFWSGVNARRAAARFVHMMLFYVALGVAMLANGPAPLVLVAVPLAFWWYTERPLGIVARRGLSGVGMATAAFGKGLLARTKRVFTRLWLLPGVILFALVFIPWVLCVLDRVPDARGHWNWQFWAGADGSSADLRPRGFFYYLPVLCGVIAPWVIFAFEGIAAPWLTRYARWQRPLLYVGLWALLGTVAASLMPFKRPFDILAVAPGLLLLLSVVADRFYAWSPHQGGFTWSVGLGRLRRQIVITDPYRLAWGVWYLLAFALLGGVVGGVIWCSRYHPQFVWAAVGIGSAGAVLVLIAGLAYIRGHGWVALGATAAASVMAFIGVWYGFAPLLTNTGRVEIAARALQEAGIPDDAAVYWVDRMPDARLSFYFGRRSRPLLDSAEAASLAEDRSDPMAMMSAFAVVKDRMESLLNSPEAAFLILRRKSYDRWISQFEAQIHVVGVIPVEPDRPMKNRVVITNVAGLRSLQR